MNAFIFDMDGTLLNTLGDIGGACNAMLKNHGYPIHPMEAYRKMVGNGFEKLVEKSLPDNLCLAEEEFTALVKEARDWYAEHLAVETDPYPGITGGLSSLVYAGAALGIFSNKPDALTKELAAHYFPSIPFVFARGAVPGRPLKPDPSILLELMRENNLVPEETAYVGDSDVDMITAHKGGLLAVGAAWGFRGEEELQKSGADIILRNPWELAEVVHARRQYCRSLTQLDTD